MSGPPESTSQLTPLKRAFLAIEQLQARLEASERAQNEPIAIIGMGCRFPGGADSPEAFWKLLCEGFDAVTEVPGDRWNARDYYDPDPDAPGKTSTKRAAFVRDIADFDPQFFGIAPREAIGMDPQQRMLLEVSWQALEHAGISPARLAGSPTGVFVGVCGSDYVALQLKWNDPTRIGPYFASGTAHSVASGRLSYTLGLQGPSVSIDTACSSSLVAVHLAYQSLRLGDCRMALAGGSHAILGPDVTIALSKARMLAADGRCKAFDADADGFVEGEGCGMVVMKRLSDALSDGDRILAVIRGSACNQDGASSGLTVPNGLSQQRVIRDALTRAGVQPSDVGFVESHGTGTPLGDPIEVQAIAAVFGQGRAADRPVSIGSVKTNIGHLQSAAGVAGLIKTVLILQHGRIPPHINLKKLSPYIPWQELPVVVPTELTPWPDGYAARIAGVTSLGFSGTNAHVIVERAHEPSPRETAESDRPQHVLTLSARSESALEALRESYADRLAANGDAFADVCHTAGAGRSHFGHRLAVVASSADDAVSKLRLSGEDIPGVFRTSIRLERPRVAFLFTGQGSQYAAMGQELYRSEKVFRDALDQCATRLHGELERPLIDVLFTPSGSSPIDETAYTQPALFAIEYALATLWRSWGVEPTALLGHSVGEYVAACIAGVFSLEDGLKMIAARARLMQSLPRGGAMAAASAGPDVVARAIASHGRSVSIAAVNGPADVVFSGPASEVDAIIQVLERRGVQVQPLAVSHAFHSALLEPMLDEFERVVSQVKLSAPRITLISNLTGRPVRDEVTEPSYWRRHAREAVQFERGIRSLSEEGCDVFVEVGPKPTLISLGRRSVTSDRVLWLPSLRQGRSDWAQLLDSLAMLYVEGFDVDWSGFDRNGGHRPIALPTYPFERSRYWLDPPPRTTGSVSSGSNGLPFAGRRLRSALQDIQFEFTPTLESPDFLADHVKQGRAIFPATGFLEMIWAAARALGDGDLAIEDFVIVEPLVLESDQPCVVQVILSRHGDREASVQVFSASGENWTPHATGVLRPARPEAAPVNLEEISVRCAEFVDPEAFYARLRQDGHEYGPSFRTIHSIRRRDGEALAEVRLTPSTRSEPGLYRAHPTLLDGALQAMAAALAADQVDATGGEAFLPVSFDRIQVDGSGATAVYSHVSIREGESSRDAMTADVSLLDDLGRPVGRVAGMQLRRFKQQSLKKADDREIDSWLYDIDWQRAPVPASDAVRREGVWLIVGSPDGLAGSLVSRLNSEGRSARLVRPGEETGAIAGAAGCAAIVHLANLDRPATNEEIMPRLERTSGSLLELVQALAGRSSDVSPGLWIVTRGAQQVAEVLVDPVQTAVWGLARTIDAEHPDLHAVTIDLDVRPGQADLDHIANEIATQPVENQVAYRDGDRYVARLTRRPSEASTRTESPQRLEISERGVLENLRLRSVERRPPAAGEVEIEIVAAGLNFRDVLNALGVYEGAAAPLGAECAGRIAALGPGVSGLAVGEPVVAFAAGAFGHFATTAAALVAPKPASCSFADAAGLPVAFVTARHALIDLAQLKAGERVLIHAAAGGVGLAAVQLAQQAGAEVFATAGSAQKHEYLRSIGVRHIMSSRSLDFAGELMAITNSEGVDVVLNSLAGEFIPRSLSVLRKGGRFLEIGKAGIWSAEQVSNVRSDVTYHAIYLGDDAETVGPLLRHVIGDVASGALKPLPSRRFPIGRAADAFRFMAQAKHIGKVIVDVSGDRPRHESPSIRSDATYLITGGLGALGFEVAAGLVAEGARTIVMAGRSQPSPVAASRMADINSQGADVRFIQTDVSRRDEVARLFQQIDRELPPLAGIVHAAAVVNDGVLVQQTWERFAPVLASKAAGAWYLHERTVDRPLDFFVMFSSTVSFNASPGQGNYAAANAFLDGLARARRHAGLPALSINWGPWSTGLAAAVELRDRRRWSEVGIGTIGPDRGVRALWRLLPSVEAQAIVWPIDWARFLRAYQPGDEPALFRDVAQTVKRRGDDDSRIIDLRAQLSRVAANKRPAVVEAEVRARALRVLALDPATAIDRREPLNALGLDSLMAVELRNSIGKLVGRVLPATLLFKYPTIEALTGYLVSDVLGLSPSSPPALDPAALEDPEAAALMDLDEEEAKRLLAEELAALGSEPWFDSQS